MKKMRWADKSAAQKFLSIYVNMMDKEKKKKGLRYWAAHDFVETK